ncbi:MAG: LPP20 family lipoprotein [Hydrogenovibrio sp.]|nr:LPP20 family lipoprotein [Hydrogenovibrio sp.]
MKKHALLLASVTGAMILAGCSNQPVDQSRAQPAMVAPAAQPAQAPAPAAQTAQAQPQETMDQNAYSKSSEKQAPAQAPKKEQPQLIKITGIGYGAESTFESYTTGQRRLMAIRASKLDAYRSLAEQLYGIKIDSNTSISTLTARNDNFRARVTALVKGARLVSVTPMADHNYETVLEVYVDKSFFNDTFVYSKCTGSNCDGPTSPTSMIEHTTELR